MLVRTKPGRTIFPVAFFIISNAAFGADVYRWTDEKGEVHFSDHVPESKRESATRVDTNAASVPERERQEAAERLAREKKMLTPPPAPATGKLPAKAETQCEAAWRKFNESTACFEAYRLVSGAMNPEAFSRCVPVAEPEPCE